MPEGGGRRCARLGRAVVGSGTLGALVLSSWRVLAQPTVNPPAEATEPAEPTPTGTAEQQDVNVPPLEEASADVKSEAAAAEAPMEGAASEADAALVEQPSGAAEVPDELPADAPGAGAESWLALPSIHGFISQGFIKTSDNNYLVHSKAGSLEFAEVGFNLTQGLGDDVTAGMQLFARDLGPDDDYRARFDWFYLEYRAADWFKLRAGRAKIPHGLYNEASDVDAARTPILLPQSLYPSTSRDFLLAVTGAHLAGYVPIESAGAIEYRAHAGTSHLDVVDRASSTAHVDSLRTPIVVGGRLLWETPLTGLVVAGSGQFLRLEGQLFYERAAVDPLIAAGTLPATFDGFVDYELDATLLVGSLEYTTGDLSLAAEYSRWHTKLEGEPAALSPSGDAWSERAHVMASLRINDWLTPGMYYALMVPDVEERNGRDAYQHDIATTLRFDLTANWLLKLEAHYMLGTAGINPALNDGVPRNELDPNWLVLMAKTTAYF